MRKSYIIVSQEFQEALERKDKDIYEIKKQSYEQIKNAKDKGKPMEGYNANREAEKFTNGKLNPIGVKRNSAAKENNVNIPSKPYEVKKIKIKTISFFLYKY